MADLDIAEQRQTLDRIEAGAEALATALKGHEGRSMSRRELMRRTLAIVDAQITLAQGARQGLDALEQAQATIERLSSDKAAAGMH